MAWPALALFPVLFIVAELILRAQAGPFWLWHVLDPSYYYLFDALNLLNLTTPGHIYHPGTPVQALGAVVLRLAYPASGAGEITAAVLADPEAHLRLLSNAVIGALALTLAWVGAVIHRAFGDLLFALMVQGSPFVSMLTVKYGYHIKPEPLLVIAILLMVGTIALAMKPGALARRPYRFALALGAIAGFGVATKITAAPVFVLPLFLSVNLRWAAAYAGFGVLLLAVFLLPAWGGLPAIAEYYARIAGSAGAYGGGDGGIVDSGRYASDLIRLLGRPAVSLPILLALLAAGIAWRRGKWPVETRILAGLGTAIALQVLLIAKQPAAFYLIPSFTLALFGLVLFYLFVAGLDLGGATLRTWTRRAVATLFAAAMLGQGFAVAKQGRELGEFRARALAGGDGRFARCAKVYYYAASAPAYALYLADYVTGSRRADALKRRIGAEEFWFNDYFPWEADELLGRAGPADFAAVLKAHPCTVFRGRSGRPSLAGYLTRTLPALRPDHDCSTPEERILTIGVDCRGRPLSQPSVNP